MKKPKLMQISSELIKDRIHFENPWWISGSIDKEFGELKRRLFFDSFYELVEQSDIRRAVVLMGPRRVGKTVLLHQSIDKLIRSGVSRHKILFLGVDNPIYLNIGPEKLFAIAREALGDINPEGWFVFFDEIQYIKNWEQHLKIIVDSYPHTKFIVSGSAAAALKYKSQESGAGRFTEFMLPPLTFCEYINLKGYDELMVPAECSWKSDINKFYSTINIRELNNHFIDYINFGGYPEMIFSEKIKENPSRYIKSDIIDKVLLRDLPGLYGIQDVQELNSFFSTLAYNSGNEVSLDSLSKGSGVEKNTLKKYLEYLGAAYLIKLVNRIDDNSKRFQRAVYYKIYLTNPSLRSAIFSPMELSDDLIGNMVENCVYAQVLHPDQNLYSYARWADSRKRGEVDMIFIDEKRLKPKWVLEIKWSNRFHEKPRELKSLLHFCKKNNLDSAMITTIDKTGISNIDGIDLFFVPAALIAYTLGMNSITKI